MTAEEARNHLRYSSWASRRLLDAAMQLPEEQLHREMNVSHKTIFDTLTHIHMADRVWMERITGSKIEQSEPLEVAWPQIWQRWEDFLDSAQDSDLARVIAYQDLRGNSHQSALWQIVLHVVNHATLHRGQVMGMFRQIGMQPPATDLIFYFREKK
jgi:uncharacterized damage-inducible protein DinB